MLAGLASESCPLQAVTSVDQSVGNFWRAGCRFFSVHWNEDLEFLLTLPRIKHFWMGTGAYIRVAKAIISPPPSAISSTVQIISSPSKTVRLSCGMA